MVRRSDCTVIILAVVANMPNYNFLHRHLAVIVYRLSLDVSESDPCPNSPLPSLVSGLMSIQRPVLIQSISR